MTAERTARVERELAHDREIAARAEILWNWNSPTGRRRAGRRAGFFVEHGRLGPGRRALEVGCGTGVFLESVARSGALVDAIDLSQDLLSQARARLSGVLSVRLLCGDVERMPYRDASFDVVYGSSVLHHLELEPALGEIQRVLKPGGRIVFAEPNLWNPHIAFVYFVCPHRLFALSPDEMAFTRRHARRALEALGYREVAVEPYDFLHPLVPVGLIPAVLRLGRWLERTPLLREIAGSLLIRARKAGS